MVGSYNVKHVDISESEGYCGQGCSDNNIDLQNLLVYHHFVLPVKIQTGWGQNRPKSCPLQQLDTNVEHVDAPLVLWIHPGSTGFLGSSTSPCISQDVEVPVRHRHQSIDLGDRHPKGAAVKSKGRAKESECVQMAILVGKIMENRKMMIEAADGMG